MNVYETEQPFMTLDSMRERYDTVVHAEAALNKDQFPLGFGIITDSNYKAT